MHLNIKKTLLAGSALVILGSFATPTLAAPREADGTTYQNGVNLDPNDHIIDGSADATDNATVDLDGSDITLGTDGAQAGADMSGSGDGDASSINFTNTNVSSATATIEQDGGSDSIVLDGDNTALTVTIGQDTAATSATGTVNVIIDGNVDSSAGGTASFVLTGDAVNTLQLDGAVLDLNGGSITLGDLDDGLTFSGSGAQTFTGSIDGGGTIVIDNGNGTGVTFESQLGNGTAVRSITIEAAAGNSSAVFENTVNTTNGIVLGTDGNAGDTNTITFDSTNQAFDVTGTITGTATETNNIVIEGSDTNTVTFNSSIGASGNIDEVTVGGTSGGNASFGGAVSTGTLGVDATGGNATAAFDAGLTTTDILLTDGGNTATLLFDNTASAVQGVSGDIDGAGANEGNILVINGADSTTNQVTFSGDVGTTSNALDTIIIGNGTSAGSASFTGDVEAATITVDGQSGTTVGAFSGDVTTTSAFNINDGSTVIFDDGSSATTITGAISTNDANGTLVFRDTNADQSGITVEDQVGTNGNRIGTIEVGEEGTFNNTATVTFEADVFADDLTILNGASVQTNALFEADVTITNTLAVEGNTSTNSGVAIFQGDINGNLGFDTGGTIVLNDLTLAKTVTGTVTTLTDGAGALIFRDSDDGDEGYTITGQVGTSNDRLRLIEIGEDDSENNSGTATFQSAVFADEISVLNGGSTTSIATFESTTASTGTLAIVGGDAGGETSTAVFQGTVTTPLIALEDGSSTATATFNGGGTFQVNGDIIGAAANNGVVSVDGAGTAVTFNDDIGLTTETLPTGASVNAVNELSITGGATATFTGDTEFNTYTITNGTYNNAGTMRVENAITLGASGVLDLSSTGTSNIILGDTFVGGTTVVDASSNNGDVNLTADVVIHPGSEFDSGTVTLVDDQGAGNASDNAAAQLTIESAFRTYTIDASGSGIDIVAGAAKSAETTASELGVSANTANKLNQAVTSTSTLPTAVQTEIDNAVISGDSTQIANAGEQLGDASTTAGAVSGASAGASRTTTTNVNQRVASLRQGYSETSGIAAGNGYSSDHIWVRGTASYLDQGERNGVDGYEADTYGATMGYDHKVAKDTTVGMAFTYSNTEIDGDSSANTKVGVDSYLLALYGSKEYGHTFVNGTLHTGVNETDISQNVLGLGRLSGDLTNWQYGASVMVGHDYKLANNVMLTPSMGLDYTRIEGDDYTLTDGTNSTSETISDKDIFLGIIGVSVRGEHEGYGRGTLIPEAHANFLYDFAGDEAETSRTFTGGVIVNDEEVNIAQETGQLGASLAYESADEMTIFSIGYDAEFREDFIGHTARAEMSIKF
jgi:uncharacterized protein with beta-barrel porin domain